MLLLVVTPCVFIQNLALLFRSNSVYSGDVARFCSPLRTEPRVEPQQYLSTLVPTCNVFSCGTSWCSQSIHCRTCAFCQNNGTSSTRACGCGSSTSKREYFRGPWWTTSPTLLAGRMRSSSSTLRLDSTDGVWRRD